MSVKFRKKGVLTPQLVTRVVALEVLHNVHLKDSFANLSLPQLLKKYHLSGQDAHFTTEIAYGTLRWRELIDAILSSAGLSLTKTPQEVLDIGRIGAYQILFMDIPAYAAVAVSVDMVQYCGYYHHKAVINAVLRKVSKRPLKEWQSLVVSQIPKEETTRRLSIRYSQPQWIIEEYQRSLEATYGTFLAKELLSKNIERNNESPTVTLCIRPTMITREELIEQLPAECTWELTQFSPLGVRVKGINPQNLVTVQKGYVGVEDEGSQIAALALLHAPLEKASQRWLDLCAGPGGKSAVLASYAHEKNALLTLNEISQHRLDLVRHNVRTFSTPPLEMLTQVDGRQYAHKPYPYGTFDKILVDAPCSGVGVIRRRPEARWRKKEADIKELSLLQQELLESAIQILNPGGVVAYVTCSPILEETRKIVETVCEKYSYIEHLDSHAIIESYAPGITKDQQGLDTQLWEVPHNTDMMFISLLVKH